MITWEEFFSEGTAPANLGIYEAQMAAFVADNRARGRPVCLVTSGGTTVPLEARMVRFLDNFSAGTRGSASAEIFLSAGYGVVFLHRSHSLLPFSRKFSNVPFQEMFTLNPQTNHVGINPSIEEDIQKATVELKKATEENKLLLIPFTSVYDYLFCLRSAAKVFGTVKRHALMYLAAAVSDFYLANSDLPQHKIQSSGANLDLSLKPVPKVLSPLVRDWAPEAFTISFKLETDPDLLISKAKKALEQYKHHLVIANILTTRKTSVVFVTPNSDEEISLSEEQVAAGMEIEGSIVSSVVQLHAKFMSDDHRPSTSQNALIH